MVVNGGGDGSGGGGDWQEIPREMKSSLSTKSRTDLWHWGRRTTSSCHSDRRPLPVTVIDDLFLSQ